MPCDVFLPPLTGGEPYFSFVFFSVSRLPSSGSLPDSHSLVRPPPRLGLSGITPIGNYLYRRE